MNSWWLSLVRKNLNLTLLHLGPNCDATRRPRDNTTSWILSDRHQFFLSQIMTVRESITIVMETYFLNWKMARASIIIVMEKAIVTWKTTRARVHLHVITIVIVDHHKYDGLSFHYVIPIVTDVL